jgi:hypothetical protein
MHVEQASPACERDGLDLAGYAAFADVDDALEGRDLLARRDSVDAAQLLSGSEL